MISSSRWAKKRPGVFNFGGEFTIRKLKCVFGAGPDEAD